jgi:uncharacterized SAM-binding protein YcdF (DUF218 family)
MRRKSYIELPTIAELWQTLRTEAQRLIPEGKENLHWASIDPFIEFLNFLGVETGEISPDKSWQEVRAISERIMNEGIEKILTNNSPQLPLRARKLYAYLSEEDAPQKSDFIITFGAKTLARANKAIELYKSVFAPKIIFSGGSPLFAKAKPEAEIYQEVALTAGVPEEALILETKSITLADNVRSTLNLLDKLGIEYKSIIVVNSPYSQRRGYSHLQKYTPVGTRIYRVNCSSREGLRENDWFTNEEGIKYVFQEYYKLWFGLVINTN